MKNELLLEQRLPSKRRWSWASRNVLMMTVALVGWWFLYGQLQPLSSWVTNSLLRLSADTHLGSAVEFFIYEAPKVLMLLTLVVFGVGMLRSFVTPERTRKMLAGKRESVGNVLASVLGVFTPFCSCSAVPLFIGFVASGVPLGVTFSFLIAAPMVNEVALVLLFGLFGWRVARLGCFQFQDRLVHSVVALRFSLNSEVSPFLREPPSLHLHTAILDGRGAPSSVPGNS